jgi:general secretion pathway protein B
MSFILDALRKSEHERQRQLGPSIAELPVARLAPRVPSWVWVALAALLSLNIALLAWFLTRDTSAAPQATATAPPPAATVPSPPVAAGAGMTTPSPQPAVATAPAEPPPQPAEPAAVEPSPPAPAVREVRPLAAEAEAVLPTSGPAFAAPDAPDPSLLPTPPRPASVTAGVPTIDQLPPQATAGLPPLEVNLHIYAAQPAQRAVFINGARYREGDSLPGGAQVREITPDGAVLSYGGQRFLLPRQ